MSKHANLAVAISEAYGQIPEREVSALFMEKFRDMAKRLREVDESADFTDIEAESLDEGISIAEEILHSGQFSSDLQIAVPQPDKSFISVERMIDLVLSCAKDLRSELLK